MGWAIAFDDRWNRDIGYGVPCVCDHPDCNKSIHRGLSYVCGGEPYGGDRGCGLFFCGDHLLPHSRAGQLCERCKQQRDPFEPKPDVREWIVHKLRHASWKPWRDQNPDEVAKLRNELKRVKVVRKSP